MGKPKPIIQECPPAADHLPMAVAVEVPADFAEGLRDLLGAGRQADIYEEAMTEADLICEMLQALHPRDRR